jgi:membrane protein
MWQWLRTLFQVFKVTFANFRKDRSPRLAAALAYYTIFSLAPTLIIAMAMVSLFIDENHAQTQVVKETGEMMGQETADLVSLMLRSAPVWDGNWVGASVTIGAMLFGASSLFAQLQDALNTIWGVQQPPINGIVAMAQRRLFAFLMLLLIGLMLLLSLFVDAALSIFDDWIQTQFPQYYLLFDTANTLLFFALLVLLFGLLYKILPNVQLRWRDIWLGAFVAAILFNLGRWVISLYIAHGATLDAFGAAGALVVLLIWIYFSAQFFLFGAEFAQVYGNHRKGPT